MGRMMIDIGVSKKEKTRTLFLSGAAAGLIIFCFMITFRLKMDYLDLLILVIAVVISFELGIIFHELGHLLFGRMSGYRFMSIRWRRWILYRDEGHFKVSQHEVYGTGGQCLMAPPDRTPVPVFLYNAGGCLVNLFLAIVASTLLFFTPQSIRFFVAPFAFINAFFAVINWFKIPGTINDGYNYRAIKNSVIHREIFVLQLNVTNHVLKDKPFLDFQLPELAESEFKKEDPYFIIYKMYHYLQHLYRLDFINAYEVIDELGKIDYENYKGIGITVHTELYFMKLYFSPDTASSFKSQLVESYMKKTPFSTTTTRIRLMEALTNSEDIVAAHRKFEQAVTLQFAKGENFEQKKVMDFIENDLNTRNLASVLPEEI